MTTHHSAFRGLFGAILLVAGPAAFAQDPAPAGRADERLRELDANKDGVLTMDEVPAQIPFAAVDVDQDGKATAEEIRNYLRKRRAPGKRPGPTSKAIAMKKTLNIPYAKMEGVDPNLLSLDVYSPTEGDEHPVLIMIHGGGWRAGDKASAGMVATKAPYFVGQGCVYVSINYRLTPAVQHPAHVQDVAKALSWVHANVANHGGDPGRIFVMGHSAGAHLAALIGTDSRRLQAEGLKLSIIKGVIPLDAGAYDIPRNFELRDEWKIGNKEIFEAAFTKDPKIQRDASPKYHVTPDPGIPPFLIFHADRKITEVLSHEFAAALEKAGVPCAVVAAPDKDHAGMNQTIGNPAEPYTPLVMRFLADPSKAASLIPGKK